jgi:putative phage-type endonuclease
MQQRTEEWRRARLGRFTASRFSDLLTEAKSKSDREAGRLSKTAESYVLGCIGEILTELPADEIETVAMKWGTEHEDDARTAYCLRADTEVEQVGFAVHPDLDYVGCSPDGLVGTDGLIEIKCPFTSREHVRTLVSREIPEQYVAQVHGQLWVTGRRWCDFVSYDPRVIFDGAELAIVRVEMDEDVIRALRSACERAREWMLRALGRIRNGETATGNT